MCCLRWGIRQSNIDELEAEYIERVYVRSGALSCISVVGKVPAREHHKVGNILKMMSISLTAVFAVLTTEFWTCLVRYLPGPFCCAFVTGYCQGFLEVGWSFKRTRAKIWT